MVFQVMLAVLAMTALQDVHASRLKTSTLVEGANVEGGGLTELDRQHVTQAEAKAFPGTSLSESSQVKGKESFLDSYDSAEPIDEFSSALVEMTSRYGLNKSKIDQAAAHPACGGESWCSCADLYNSLIENCEVAEEGTERERECDALVSFLWKGKVPSGHGGKTEKAWRKWGYDVFLKNFRLAEKIFDGDSQTLAGFWTGYSWTLGTRQVFDRAIDSKLRPEAFGMASSHYWHLEDIEYKHHRIGAVMRHLKWDRKCHNSGHDSVLWLTLSKAYAEGTSEEAQRAPVVVFVNKKMSQLNKSFLFKHELELMEEFSEIILVDYKNECDPELISSVRARNKNRISQISCLKGSDQNQMGQLFHDAKDVAGLANDIKKFEAGYAPGIKWDIKEMVPLYAEKRKKAASFEECQTFCNQWKECNLFSYDSQKGECEMFHRKSELHYEYTSEAIISGRSRRKESCGGYTCPKDMQQISHSFSQYGQSNCCKEPVRVEDLLSAAGNVLDLTSSEGQSLLNASGMSRSSFIRLFVGGGGKTVKLPVNVRGYDHSIHEAQAPGLNALGIDYLRVVRDNGLWFRYRFYIYNTRTLTIWITDYEPDTYKCWCFRHGSHYVGFKSERPGIHYIRVEL